MEIGAYLYLRISGNDIDFEEIAKNLNTEFSIIYKRGEVYDDKYHDIVSQENSWSMRYEIPERQSFEDAIIEFVTPFLLKREYITNLSQKHAVTLWISLYPEGNQVSISLSSKIISILHNLNVEFGITAAYLSDFYNGIV